MTDRDRDVRKRCAEIADEAATDFANAGGSTGGDYAHGARAASRDIARRIRGLDLPLTSAREVTDVMVEAGAKRAHEYDRLKSRYAGRGLPKWDKELPEYRAAACAKTRSILEAALASAPQPACVGEWEARDPGHPHLIAGEFQSDKYPTCPTIDKIIALLEELRSDNAQLRMGVFHYEALYKEASIDRYLSPAPSPQADGETWQPIATAPKDGTLLIGFVPGSALYEVIFIRHWEDEDTWRHDMGDKTVPMDMEPTHWMPIPEVPALSARREG